jgi:hypothetical protein
MSDAPAIQSVIALLNERRAEAKRVVRELVFGLERELKESLTGTRSGRLYRRTKTTGKKRKRTVVKFHQASAPGEAPASDSGNLIASIQSEISGDGFNGEVSLAYYAAFFDPGTSKMDPRPYLVPAIQKMQPVLNRLRAVGGS